MAGWVSAADISAGLQQQSASRSPQRTSTDRNGRYAADALPDDRITLLVSPPDRIPIATRAMLASDLSVRQDVVIPDPAHSAALAFKSRGRDGELCLPAGVVR